ncbi:hypothetical protein EQU24_18250 [Methylotuvimicrobium buryatense]|uniref:Uncharacterized protein n=1 Tax=Methylotuvimicrobium buryatense TaxID=95641 RepID=A0A4P9UW48_METBY|nr:hypothetical protein EQU24_18250 [Methylotuvimicrobium buryatense]
MKEERGKRKEERVDRHAVFLYPHQTPSAFIPFALQISAVPEGCSVKALPAWRWHRAYMGVFTASFNGRAEAGFSSTMSIIKAIARFFER